MKRTLFVMMALVVAVGISGCASTGGTGVPGLIRGSCARAPEMCAPCDACCDPGCCGGLLSRCSLGRLRDPGHGTPVVTQPGPPMGQVAYPYYTTRGPRDFLLDNPPSIGP